MKVLLSSTRQAFWHWNFVCFKPVDVVWRTSYSIWGAKTAVSKFRLTSTYNRFSLLWRNKFSNDSKRAWSTFLENVNQFTIPYEYTRIESIDKKLMNSRWTKQLKVSAACLDEQFNRLSLKREWKSFDELRDNFKWYDRCYERVMFSLVTLLKANERWTNNRWFTLVRCLFESFLVGYSFQPCENNWKIRVQ